MFVLALSDGAQVTLAIFQLGFSCIVSVVLWKVTAAQRRNEGMETKLGDLASKLVEERFRGMSHQVNTSVEAFSKTLANLTEHIKEQEQHVDGLGERDTKNELAFAAKLDQLKDWLRDNMASKKDLDKHEGVSNQKFDTVQREVGQLSKEVAVLGEKVKAEH
jgi:hypothetical protein